ncbi:tetratricopeptide repeat protein [Spirulina major]|uniref:tetratricopeptide repeat protein n=1 Tax=Spirulina major TaxID=270636 RepID=UPI000932AB84|nr:tetratricopeptide repeat protein [Spirulina major]
MAQRQYSGLALAGWVMILGLGIAPGAIAPTWAQSDDPAIEAEQDEEAELIHPLQRPITADPLLPERIRAAIQTEARKKKRDRDPNFTPPPLNAAEAIALETALDDLAQAGQVALDNDAPETAYELWFQELRLRRFLGPLAEIEALTRVGRLAWEQSRNGDVAAITERLSTIQTEANLDPIDPDAERDRDEPPPTPPDLTSPLIQPLAEAYEAVRSYPQAVLMYRYQLATLGADFDERQPVLENVARLHRDWFKFSEAIAIYQDLLTGARSQADLANEQVYLEELARLYDETDQWTEAIATKEDLFTAYLAKPLFVQKLAPLRLSIARNYAALGDGEQASEFYQQAFTLAWAAQQYAYASEALETLAALYTDYGQLNEAIALYREQLKAAQYAYDQYTMMQTYDRMAQLYRELKNYPQALSALQAGLEIANRLGHREAYFEEQLEIVAGESF